MNVFEAGGRLPLVHIDDAVRATVRAADRASSGEVYDIVDDRSVSLVEKLELGWCPAFPTLEDGLADMFRRAV